jgi:nucleotide-binding universal stress UspA family protein
MPAANESRSMTYATLMVPLQLGQANGRLLEVAGELAEAFGATLIGIAAGQPTAVVYGEGFVDGELMALDQQTLERQLVAAQAEFRQALQARSVAFQWRSTICFGALDYLACEARSADLIIVAGPGTQDRDDARRIGAGEFVLAAGRPVLVVPAAARSAALARVMVAWKDTREARRAVADALPLLVRASRVTVVEIVPEADLPAARSRLDDVVAWLGRHGVTARPVAAESTGDDATGLADLAHLHEAELIVAGAYGHSRLREWAFGGLTRDLLLRGDHAVLLSH